MGINYTALASEISTDPLTRGYSTMSDAEVAADMNTAYRPKPGTMKALFEYIIATRTHTNTGQDNNTDHGTPSTLLGRLIHAAEQSVHDADPFGCGTAGTQAADADKKMSMREIHSAKAFLEMVRYGVAGDVDFTNSDTGDILSDLINGGVMTAANKTAIEALSQNIQTRAQELADTLNYGGSITASHVAYARTL